VTVIVFKDLHKLASYSQKENTTKKLFQKLQGKPFWIWNIGEHKLEDVRTNGDCCFNHIIGLPQKDGLDKPLYDYEGIIFDALCHRSNVGSKGVGVGIESTQQPNLATQNGNVDSYSSSSGNKHLWIKKATGLGVYEFMLRFMAWLCLKDNALSGSQMCIVTIINHVILFVWHC
jgi:hypothetical protein